MHIFHWRVGHSRAVSPSPDPMIDSKSRPLTLLGRGSRQLGRLVSAHELLMHLHLRGIDRLVVLVRLIKVVVSLDKHSLIWHELSPPSFYSGFHLCHMPNLLCCSIEVRELQLFAKFLHFGGLTASVVLVLIHQRGLHLEPALLLSVIHAAINRQAIEISGRFWGSGIGVVEGFHDWTLLILPKIIVCHPMGVYFALDL